MTTVRPMTAEELPQVERIIDAASAAWRKHILGKRG